MRRFDKKTNIQKANLLSEQRYLESKGVLNERWIEDEAFKTINRSKEVSKLIDSMKNVPVEVVSDGKPVLYRFTEMKVNEPQLHVMIFGEASFDGGKTWTNNNKNRSLTDKSFNNTYSFEQQNGDNRFITTAFENHKNGMATEYIDGPRGGMGDDFKMRPIEKQINVGGELSEEGINEPEQIPEVPEALQDEIMNFLSQQRVRSAAQANDNKAVFYDWLETMWSPQNLHMGADGNEIRTNNPKLMSKHLVKHKITGKRFVK